MRKLSTTMTICALSAGALIYASAGVANPLDRAARAIGLASQGIEKSSVLKVQRRRRRRRGRNAGAAAAAGAVGLMFGLMASEAARQHEMAIEDCMRRYRSYDPETQTWVDLKGRVRRCP